MSIEKTKDNKNRIIFGLIMLVLLVISFFAESYINNHFKDTFAYYASVVTIIALLISIFEIFNSISISKSLKEISELKLNEFKNEAGSVLAHECINLFENTIDSVTADDYPQCYLHFKMAKKIHSNIYSRYPTNGLDDKKSKLVMGLEKRITALRNAPVNAGPNNLQKTSLLKDLISVKQEIESLYIYKKNEA